MYMYHYLGGTKASTNQFHYTCIHNIFALLAFRCWNRHVVHQWSITPHNDTGETHTKLLTNGDKPSFLTASSVAQML